MKVKLKYIFGLFIVLRVVCSCDNKPHSDKDREIDANSTNVSKVSELFDSIRVIPLETVEKSLLGIRIKRVEIFENRIYVLNMMTSRCNILCFDLNGKFLFNIDKIGNGPDEYTYLGDFFIDISKRQIVLLSENRRVLFFDLNGGFLFAKNAPEESFTRQNIFVNDSTYLGYNDVEETPLGYNLIEFNANSLSIRKKSNKIKEPLGYLSLPALAVFNKEIFYYNINDTIYDVTDINNPKALYHILLGKDNDELKSKIINKVLSNREEGREMLKASFNNNELRVVGAFFVNNDWIAINIHKWNSENNMFDTSILFYDKVNNKTYNSNNIEFNVLNIREIKNIEVVGSNGKLLYILLNNEFSQQTKEDIKNSSWISGNDKKALIQRNVENNPVLLEVKLMKMQ